MRAGLWGNGCCACARPVWAATATATSENSRSSFISRSVPVVSESITNVANYQLLEDYTLGTYLILAVSNLPGFKFGFVACNRLPIHIINTGHTAATAALDCFRLARRHRFR